MLDIVKLINFTNISYMKRQLRCVIFLLLNTVFTLIYPSFISFIIDRGVTQGNLKTIFSCSFIMLIVGVAIMITNCIQHIMYAKLGKEICEILRNKIFQKLCVTNYKFWNENRVGDVFTIINTDVSMLEKILTTMISESILNVLYFGGITIILIFYNIKIGILISTLVVLFVILQKKNGIKVKHGMSELRDKMGAFNSNTQEMINNMPDLQLLYTEDMLTNKYAYQNKETKDLYIQQIKNMLGAKNISSGFKILSVFIVLLIGGESVLHETMSVGALFSIVVYVQQLYSPAVALGDAYNSIKNAQPSIFRIINLLENKEIVKGGDLYPSGHLNGNIVFKNVTFSYEKNKNKIFNKLNLSLESGKIYGIVGDNGVGKSTFIRLLSGLCTPNSGYIYINGVALEKYNVEYLRAHIGYLLQKPFLLSGENPVDSVQGKKVMEQLNLEQINHIDENNKGLSGGENQKLALAFLLSDKEKDIYILDEPTAAVDLKMEETICTQIREDLKGKTVLIITHRTSILKICDKIIDFNKILPYKNVRTM